MITITRIEFEMLGDTRVTKGVAHLSNGNEIKCYCDDPTMKDYIRDAFQRKVDLLNEGKSEAKIKEILDHEYDTWFEKNYVYSLNKSV